MVGTVEPKHYFISNVSDLVGEYYEYFIIATEDRKTFMQSSGRVKGHSPKKSKNMPVCNSLCTVIED